MNEHLQARNRMCRMGFEAYDLERRVLSIPAGAEFDMMLWNVWLYVCLEDTAPSIRVDSSFGVLDLAAGHPVQQLEHTGRVTVSNRGLADGLLIFHAAAPRNSQTNL